MKSPASNVANLATSGHTISTLSVNGASTERLGRNVTNSMRSVEEKKYPVPSVAINLGSTPSNLNEVIAGQSRVFFLVLLILYSSFMRPITEKIQIQNESRQLKIVYKSQFVIYWSKSCHEVLWR